MNKEDHQLALDVISKFMDENREDFTQYNDVGKTLQNYITEEKSKITLEAIAFTIKYLREHKHESN